MKTQNSPLAFLIGLGSEAPRVILKCHMWDGSCSITDSSYTLNISSFRSGRRRSDLLSQELHVVKRGRWRWWDHVSSTLAEEIGRPTHISNLKRQVRCINRTPTDGKWYASDTEVGMKEYTDGSLSSNGSWRTKTRVWLQRKNNVGTYDHCVKTW